jgi:hypothetical protein
MFITTEKGMCGWYIILADNSGPIERLEDWNYDNYEDCCWEADELARAFNIRYVS